MNYKLMQRPMFRLGGNVRQNYSNGTEIADIEKIIRERAALREKAIGGIRTALPLQVLANQPIESIRSIGDVVNILSGLPKDPGFLGALTKLPSLDLKMKEGELTDKITLAKLKQGKNKKFEFEKRLDIARDIEKKQQNLLAGKSEAEQKKIRGTSVYRNLEKRKNSVLREMSEADFIFQQALKNPNTFDIESAKELYDRIQSGLAEGGRVGFQEGTPDPTLPQPKPKEPMDDRKVENLMRAAPALENPGEVKQMAMKDEDVFAALRRRLPREITDDVIRLIAYNAEAFADFADISDQSDVDSFNEKYNVQLVLPVENVT
jgi:hypothetical protein